MAGEWSITGGLRSCCANCRVGATITCSMRRSRRLARACISLHWSVTASLAQFDLLTPPSSYFYNKANRQTFSACSKCWPLRVESWELETWLTVWLCINVSAATPVCSDNISAVVQHIEEFSRVDIRCNVTYSGNWKPFYQCQPEPELMDVRETSDTIEYRYTVNITRNLHRISLSCHLNFTYGSTFGRSAVAVVDGYRYQWRSPPINVTCKFDNVKYSICTSLQISGLV